MTFLQLLVRLFTLVSLAILAAGIWLVADYGVRAAGGGPAPAELLGWGLGLLAWSFLGGAVARFALGRPGDLHGAYEPGPGRLIEAPDGARLWVESHGDPHAPALILTHDRGLDSTVWREAKRELSRRHRVIVWDLPGCGRSAPAPDGAVSLERMAGELEAVLAMANGPALLVGHGLGAMVVQSFCRLRPEAMGTKVAGIVLENAAATAPAGASFLGGLLRALERPVLRPLLRLQIALAPLAALAGRQAALSGWMQAAQRIGGFGPAPCRTLLDHACRLAWRQSPAAAARQSLAMMDFDRGGENRQAMAALRTPALVFAGGRDLVARPRAASELAGLLRAHENRVSFAGHHGPIECPSWYDHALKGFADHVFTRGAVWADRAPAPGPAAAAAAARRPEPRSWAPATGVRPGLQPM